MESLQDAVDEVAPRAGFSGVVRVDRAGETEVSCGVRVRRPRAASIPNTVETRFATASGTKV